LKEHGNVLITGAPASGKTHLLQEVREAFKGVETVGYDPTGPVAIPAVDDEVAEWLPSPERSDREVFETNFHQNTKFGEVLRAREARVSTDGSGGTTFRVSEGILYRASQHALGADGTALLIVDELNRGPAVAVFGPTMTALEFDKRLDADGDEVGTTAKFELLDDEGNYVEYAFPQHLYVLAAMNEADTSVEALDVAFMRRWEPYTLEPDEQVLIDHFGIASAEGDLPEEASGPDDVYRATVRAWRAANRRIRLGRGAEYEIGHGIFMSMTPSTTSVGDALEAVRPGYRRLRQHLDEVFFGSTDSLAAALNVDAVADHPIKRVTEVFANDSVSVLEEPKTPDDTTLYKILRAIAG
jgi:5-methylcytosine-specific restriction protein B